MRKIILIIVGLFMALVLSGCGNERLFEVGNDVNTFNYAFVEVGNTIEEMKVKDRYIKDPTRMVMVATDDNKVYYTHSSNYHPIE